MVQTLTDDFAFLLQDTLTPYFHIFKAEGAIAEKISFMLITGNNFRVVKHE